MLAFEAMALALWERDDEEDAGWVPEEGEGGLKEEDWARKAARRFDRKGLFVVMVLVGWVSSFSLMCMICMCVWIDE